MQKFEPESNAGPPRLRLAFVFRHAPLSPRVALFVAGVPFLVARRVARSLSP